MSLKFEHMLDGHGKSINALSISPDGTILLSGDDAVLIVWNLATGEKIQTFSSLFHGPVSAITWITLDSAEGSAFVFGCADGSLHLYKRTDNQSLFSFVMVVKAFHGAVEGVAFDPHHRRLAGIGSTCAMLWNVTREVTIAQTALTIVPYSVTTTYHIRNIIFCDEGASALVCYLESHQVSCYSIEPLSLRWTKYIPTHIGHAILIGQRLIVSNLHNGVDEYILPTLERMQSFTHPIIRNFPLQLANTRDGKWLVSGGDDGHARVYDRQTGQLVERLEHDPNPVGVLVQVVAAHSRGESCIIVTGGTSVGLSIIKVWRHIESPASRSKYLADRGAAGGVPAWKIILIIIFTSMAMNIVKSFIDMSVWGNVRALVWDTTAVWNTTTVENTTVENTTPEVIFL